MAGAVQLCAWLPRRGKPAACWRAAARARCGAAGRPRTALRHPRGAHVGMSWTRLLVPAQCIPANRAGQASARFTCGWDTALVACKCAAQHV